MTAPPWLQPPRAPRGARVTLFCFICADGNAALLPCLRQGLDRTADVFDVQCGMHAHGPCMPGPLPSIDTLGDSLARQMAAATGTPAIFFGYGSGASIALALVRRLHRIGARCPVKLILSGCAAPADRTATRELLAIPITVLADSRASAQQAQRIGAWEEATTGRCRVHWLDGPWPEEGSGAALLLAHIEAELQEAASGP